MSVRRAEGRGRGELGSRPPGQVGAAAAQLKPTVLTGNADLCSHSLRHFQSEAKNPEFYVKSPKVYMLATDLIILKTLLEPNISHL